MAPKASLHFYGPYLRKHILSLGPSTPRALAQPCEYLHQGPIPPHKLKEKRVPRALNKRRVAELIPSTVGPFGPLQGHVRSERAL
jgi:hypothetical protein